MIDPNNVPEVDPEELLARFIVSRSHIRPSDDTIKPDAFIPHPYKELSATRHRDATEEELWQAGQTIAAIQKRTLYGRGDVLADVFNQQELIVTAAPVAGDTRLPDNPNHVNVIGWPDDKAQQKLIALNIVAKARLIHPPKIL